MADLLNRVGRSAFNYLSGESGGVDNGFVGSIVEVDGLRVQVSSQLGEGGCAVIYSARDSASGKEYALKRFLVFDEASIKSVVTEIKLLKELKPHPDIVDFVTAASIEHTEGRKMKEFLLLMQLCPRGDLAKLLQCTLEPLSPRNVCLTMSSLCRALAALHNRSQPVIHRDIKLENLLIDANQEIKLCDLGSCTTIVHNPTQDWNANQRNILEDELAKYSTPMYRAPEMLDTWSNYPVNQSVDIWAAGCVLFCICYNKHPFEDSNKLAIVNGNYKIPANDSRYTMYNNLIKSMLTLDPRNRPTATQVLEEISAIAETHGFPTRGSLDLPRQVVVPPTHTPLSGHTPLSAPATPSSHPTTPEDPGYRLGVGSMAGLRGAAGVAGAANITALKGAAGSIFSRLKDTTKHVVASVQQTISPRELDFHCITSRVAAMAFPVEGIESTYRNHIEDVKNMMETAHSGHYTVYNLAERTYPGTRYPTGSLVNYSWPAGSVPALDYLIDILSNILEYLARDARNVVVVHCLDGKSSTALVVCGLLIYSTFVSTPEQAIAVFTSKRFEPTLTPSQMYYLNHLNSLVRSTPPVLKSPFVSLSNLVIEPIPLFNKAGEGCTPYVEIYQDKTKALSTLQDYSRMKGYSVISGDECASIPLNITVCGDVTVAIYHARQALTKTTGIKICQFQFHTNSLTPGRPSNVWNLPQLDQIIEPVRYADDFRVVLNCDTSEECSGKSLTWPSPQSKQLLFNSEQDYEATSRLVSLPPNKFLDNNPGFGKPFPESRSIPVHLNCTAAPSIIENKPTPVNNTVPANSAFDLLGLNSDPVVQQPKVKISPTEDLIPGFGTQPEPSESSVGGVEGFDFLSELNQPAPSNPQNSSGLADLLGEQSSELHETPLLDIGAAEPVKPVPRVTSSPNLAHKGNLGTNQDPFADFSTLTSSLSNQNLLAGQPMGASVPMKSSQPMGASKPMGGSTPMGANPSSFLGSMAAKPTPAAKTPNNLLGDFDLFAGTPTPSSPGLNNNHAHGSSMGGKSPVSGNLFPGSNGNLFPGSNGNIFPGQKPSSPGMTAGASVPGMTAGTLGPKVSTPMGPNYSRSFFQPQEPSLGGVKPRVSQGAFDDLLGGFNPTSRDNQNRTIGEMKKVEVTKTMDPDDIKIMEWKEGKERNIRTLLSSLHKVLWEGARWNECNISQLVGPSDVKKMYRKACLTVHPDKWMDTDYENISKLTFMELNEAWSEFENDPNQQNMFR
ncbi:cyclin-G-associated kinase [Eurytemora carolleeae]|uniref:cyclin-G-associated kinase n=1 Tax=Eurytemora carolleeae TaxID=1294199 RepID=UPI000C787CD2|nr:cyclin-G-associated kinase [Eurytemora carolleeae]|eukprot:XP_023343351.1 cyclin-G-associated kinase-like [Eurytemora affinis]